MRVELTFVLILAACGSEPATRDEPGRTSASQRPDEGEDPAEQPLPGGAEITRSLSLPVVDSPAPPAPATLFTIELLPGGTRVERCDPEAACRSVEGAGPLTDPAFAALFAPPHHGEAGAVIRSHAQVEHARIIRLIDALRTFGITRYAINADPAAPAR